MHGPTERAPREVRFLERVVRWGEPGSAVDPGSVSGLELIQGIRDGIYPPPPLASVIGFRCVLAEPGEVGMRLDYEASLENLGGMLHGGSLAVMLDTAMGAAASTLLPAGAGSVTLDLHISYLRPARAPDCPLSCVGRVVNPGRRNTYVTGEVHDRQGRLLAHAVGNFTVIGGAA